MSDDTAVVEETSTTKLEEITTKAPEADLGHDPLAKTSRAPEKSGNQLKSENRDFTLYDKPIKPIKKSEIRSIRFAELDNKIRWVKSDLSQLELQGLDPEIYKERKQALTEDLKLLIKERERRILAQLKDDGEIPEIDVIYEQLAHFIAYRSEEELNKVDKDTVSPSTRSQSSGATRWSMSGMTRRMASR